MQVSRIEIFGFKSFMDRLSLPIGNGITGIVGPNGCGKSNIVDAIRWILGETQARNLRGGVLEDVIFNGTDKLRPLGLAEVSITIQSDTENFLQDLISPELEAELIAKGYDSEEDQDTEIEQDGLRLIEGGGSEEENEDQDLANSIKAAQTAVSKVSAGSLLEKYSWLKSANEVQVTRRLYRSGESEFFINRVPCRLKDMKDFFRAVGLSAKGFTIVAQGEVSRIVTSKPHDRRKVLEEAAGVQGFRDRINSTENRLKETHQNLERIEDILTEVSRQVIGLKRQANKARNREELKDQIKNLDQKIYSTKLLNFSESDSGIGEAYQHAMQEEQELQKTFQEKNNERSAFRAELIQLDLESDELREKVDSIRDNLNTVIKERSERASRLTELKALLESLESEDQHTKSNLSDLRQRIEKIEAEVKDQEEKKIALSAELERLDQQQSELERLKQSVLSKEAELKILESQLAAKAVSSEFLTDIDAQAVNQKLDVEPEYHKAVNAVLSDTEYLAVDDLQAAFQAKAASITYNANITFVSNSALEIESTESLKSLLSVIGCSDDIYNALKVIFADIYVSNTAEEAFQYFQDNPNSKISIVTKEGVVFKAKQACFRNTNNSSEQIRIKVDELTVEIKDLRSQLAESQPNDDKTRELVSNLGEVNGKLASSQSLLEQLKIDHIAMSKRDTEIATMQTKYSGELQQLKQLPENDYSQEEKINQELESCNSQYQSKDSLRKTKREQLDSLNQIVENLRDDLDQARQAVSEKEFARQKMELDLDSIREKILIEYNEDFYNDLKRNSEQYAVALDDLEDLEQEVIKLKTRMAREGEIDPESIERYEEEQKRMDELESQRNDLAKASKSIKETLDRLIETSEKRFVETFNKVSENFSRLVPKLFGGGSGRLELSDPENPLESGLDIIAKPPGKKLKNIELMSGGEKALCATALIVSMFLVRPSPLCVLDEVDAPLDDANLARFLGIVKEMSAETQFVLITHNKQSMGVADKLVGVTMQQPGATKVISVSLQEAYEQVA